MNDRREYYKNYNKTRRDREAALAAKRAWWQRNKHLRNTMRKKPTPEQREVIKMAWGMQCSRAEARRILKELDTRISGGDDEVR